MQYPFAGNKKELIKWDVCYQSLVTNYSNLYFALLTILVIEIEIEIEINKKERHTEIRERKKKTNIVFKDSY